MRFIDPDGNDWIDFLKGVGKGVVNGVVNTAVGVAQMLDPSPASQFKIGLAVAATNPKQAYNNIKQSVKNTIQEAKDDKTGGKAGELTGEVITQVGLAVAGTKGLDKLAKVGEAANAANAGGQTIYRAVNATEEAVINSTGRFSLEGQDIGLKYFAKSVEDAHQYGQWLYKDGYKVIEATVKGPLNINKFWYPNVDIGAYAFPQEVLPYIIPK